MKYFNLKFLLLFFALAVALPPAWALEVTDVLTVQATGINLSSSSYQDFSNLKSNTEAVYAGKIARGQSSTNPSIQLRSSNSDAGIITTTSGGKAKSITITFNSYQTETKTVKVYGKNSAYSSAGDLFGTSTRGEEIGSVSSYSNNGSTVTLTGEYEYIGIRSNSGAIYIDKIEIVWDTPQVLDYAATVTPTGALNFGKAAPNTSATLNVAVKNTGANAITPTVSGLATPFSTTYVPTSIATGETATIPVVFSPTALGDYEGTMNIGAVESSNIDIDVDLAGTCALEMTVCNNNETTGYLPVYGYNHDLYNQINQMVYPSTMLQSLNGKKITAMTFHLSGGMRFYNGDVTFSLANLSANTPPYESTPTRIEGFTKVHTEVMPGSSQPSLTEWTILFDEPFTYTGGDLLIDVATTKGDWGSTYFYGATQGSNQSYYTSESNTYEAVNFLPKITFAYIEGGETPVVNVDAPVFNPEDGTTFEENLTVTLTCATAGANIQYSYNGEYFTDYSTPIVIDETTTIYAKAVLGDVESNVVSATYTKEEPITPPTPSDKRYIKVYNTTDLNSGTYLIVYEEGSIAFDGSLNQLDAVGNYIPVTIADTRSDKYILGNEVIDAATFEFDANAKTLKSASGYYIGMTSDANGLNSSESTTYSNAISITDGFDADIVSSGTHLRYNNASNQTRFRYYKSGSYTNQKAIQLYKLFVETAEPVDPEMSFGEMTAFTVYPKADFTAPTLTTNPADLPVTYSSSDEDVAVVDPATGEVVIGTKIGTTTITATFDGNDEYNHATATYTITVEARPFLMADPTTLTMTTTVGTSVEKKFTVMGENLKGNVTLTLNDENEVYSIDPATITVGAKADDEDGHEITVTYNPTAVGTHNATITIASQDAEDVTITLNGTSTKPALSMALTPAEGTFTVGEDAKVYVTMQNGDENTMVTYKVNNGTEQNYTEEGIVLPNTKAGTVTVDAFATDGEREATASATYTFEAAEAIVVTLNPAGGQYYVGDQVTVTVTAENTIGDYLVTYKINDGEEQDYDGTGIVITNDQMGTVNLEVTVADGYEHEAGGTATGAYNFIVRPVVETPTFSPMPGSYTEAQTVTISCATEGATILYSTDGGNSWTTGNTVNISETTTLMAKATKEDGGYIPSEVATGKYTIIVETPLQPIEPMNGYFSVTNNGNNKYVNVAGRKTINFTDAPDQMAGTVIRLETNEVGQVQTLRSQAADLQGYANRAMKYVPEIVQLVADKLHAEGDGNLLGDEGLDAIMAKFDECFDYHLYVEEAEGGYRLYGKTPSMQPVVDFYREHTTQVETKLPMLEQFINDAIDKVLNKTNGSGSSILKHFSLHETWQRMGGTLTEPVDDASTMQFYREVLNDKDNVWSFAYETAMTYWERVKKHPRYPELKEQLGEFADYIEKIEDVHPDFKYYIVQQNGKIDYISQGNKDIQGNDPRTIWTLNPRTDFKVNIPEENAIASEYAATLYTDFAYTLPEGVTAYKVTTVTAQGVAQLAALEGTIPAQTPVILKATEPGVKTLTLSMDATAAPTDNLLVGADYFIQEYNIRTPQVESLFNMVKDLLGESFYNNYVAKYEHLMLKTAGTVNNKYFWALSSDDLDKAVVMGENNEMTSVVRTLSTGEDGLGFYKLWSAPANQAFLATDKFNPVKLTIKGDIDRDGIVSINDVTALIDILLMLPERPYEIPYDYVAADFNETDGIEISDLSDLIEYLMTLPAVPVTPADPLVPQDD